METTNLLLEIGTEELPTKAVIDLPQEGERIWAKIFAENFIKCSAITTFGSPRRMAWIFHDIELKQQDRQIEKKGPNLAAAKKDGEWTQAAIGFAKSCGVNLEDLQTKTIGKADFLYFYGTEKGEELKNLFPKFFAEFISQLPIAKRMRWSNFGESFVRPVNTLTLMANSELWDLEFFGIKSSNLSQGHRVHCPEVRIFSALTYEKDLEQAKVIASIEKRKEIIKTEITKAAKSLNAKVLIDEDLVEEVACLTEFPVAVLGNFEPEFLEVPKEVLITTMADNQKTFAVVDEKGNLLPHFVAVANVISQNPAEVAHGNERVIRPRFADAKFFLTQDLKHKLEDYLPRLEKVVYQAKLGSLADKSRRLIQSCEAISPIVGADIELTKKAAALSKCDLQTEMVMEFPELQGLMGNYYAQKEGLNPEIALALEEQYYPLGDKDIPQSKTGTVLSMAEKLDNLIGGFAIGAKPTGSKDPYALRRASIGLIRIILKNNLKIKIAELLNLAVKNFPAELKAEAVLGEIRAYILERLAAFYKEQNIKPEIYNAVSALDLDDLVDFEQRIKALNEFSQKAEAEGFFSSAKRIRNILKKNGEVKKAVDIALFKEEAEENLWHRFTAISGSFKEKILNANYASAMELLGSLAPALATFFDSVMVMADEENLKNNRLALLTALQKEFDEIADLSLISK